MPSICISLSESQEALCLHLAPSQRGTDTAKKNVEASPLNKQVETKKPLLSLETVAEIFRNTTSYRCFPSKLFLLAFYLENEGYKTPGKLLVSSIWCLIYFPQHRTRLLYLARQNCCNLLFIKLLPQCHISELCNTKSTGGCRSGWLFPLYGESLLGFCQPVHMRLQKCANCLERILNLRFTGLSVDSRSTIWEFQMLHRRLLST